MKKQINKLFFFIVLVIISQSNVHAQVYDTSIIKLCDSLAMIPPVINTKPDKIYSQKNLDYGMTIGIERTPKGRIWNCVVAGGDDPKAFFVLSWSDDNGRTWTDTKVAIDPQDKSLPLRRRTIVGQLWTDPLGRLWLFFDQAMTYFDGRAGNWYSLCKNPDAKNPVWSKPKYIGFGCTLQKPTVASTGEWILPVSLWDRDKIDWHWSTDEDIIKSRKKSPLTLAYKELDSYRGAHVFVSTNQGKTWERRGMVTFPDQNFDEHIIIEKTDGTWWMTARTRRKGIYQSFSRDKGLTWSAPEPYIDHTDARHFIVRLQSGNLLLVRHGMPGENLRARSHLTAFISKDDGKTWSGALLLDERMDISYPTGFQAPDGYIYISYDRERAKKGEILMARFTEEDILAKGIISQQGELKRLIFKAGKLNSIDKTINKTRLNSGGPYFLDGIKTFNGEKYSLMNNYLIGHNALVRLNQSLDTCEIIGHILKPYALKMTEGAVNIMPDGSYFAVLRQDGGSKNYLVSQSIDGNKWTSGIYALNIPNGSDSKPTLDKFGDTYYMGWQSAEKVDNVGRSVFNIDVSRDGVHWERKYIFKTPHTFQYPVFKAYNDKIYLSVTNGEKERICFGLLEDLNYSHLEGKTILPTNWNAKEEADKVLERLITVTEKVVKGAHDADMVLMNNKAYVVYEANDFRKGESAEWADIYSAMSIVDLTTIAVDSIFKIGVTEQQFENQKLPKGAVFVPRITEKNENELRVFFTSEDPHNRASQMWYTDFDVTKNSFSNKINKMKMKTSFGTFDLNTHNFFDDAVNETTKKVIPISKK